jgi:hypothetical protein
VGLSRGLTTAGKGWRTVRKDVVHSSYRRGEARGNGHERGLRKDVVHSSYRRGEARGNGHERGLHDATVMLRRLDRFNGTGR